MDNHKKPASGELIVALAADGKEVVITHQDLQSDAEGCGHIVFSPDQATNLAGVLYRKANIARGLVCGHCGDVLSTTGWATALVRYCFKEECQQEFYKEAQAMIRKVDPEIADRLAAAVRGNAFTTVDGLNEKPAPDEAYANANFTMVTFTCPKCGIVSHNLKDADQRYCGACNLFFGELEIGLHGTSEIPCKNCGHPEHGLCTMWAGNGKGWCRCRTYEPQSSQT